MTGARVSVDQITDMIQSLHPHLRQGVSFPHPLLFQPVDAQPLLQREFMHPQPLYPLAAGAAEKNKKQQDDDPPHVVAVKEIAKAAHRKPPLGRSNWFWCVSELRGFIRSLLYHYTRHRQNGHKNFSMTFRA